MLLFVLSQPPHPPTCQAETSVLEEEARATKEHDLLTSIHSKNYVAAIGLAFELGHSFRLWGVFNEVMETPSRQLAAFRFDSFVDTWDDVRLLQCLEFIREWNTNATKSGVAQVLLGSILRRVPMKRLEKIPHMSAQVESILPYTDRHYNRMDRLLQASYLIDYTCASISAIGV